jgi:ArsR family transcriptional regulator, arsenate/arsenite/antimonite-responsive transcriptional repressor
LLSYDESALLLKAIADGTRLKIIDMLSCGELCACNILEAFSITQPTLSYHMKVLTDSGLVEGRKVGTWMHYTLNGEAIHELTQFLDAVTAAKDNCICKGLG